ncbi:MAG: nucleotide exchange factor GrpE [Pyramidobacter sp.]|jgi:molecular chaperone GrpE
MEDIKKNTGATAGTDGAPQTEIPQPPGADVKTDLEKLKEQYEQMREIAARAQADGINYRNWAEREMTRLKAYGSERAVVTMLPVFDNLERALANAEADPHTIKEGVRMVREQFAVALRSLGVTEIDPAGKPFTPAEHDAMGMVPVTEKEQDGLVHTVVRKGFQMSDKVIRPAMVMVGRYTEAKPAEEKTTEEQNHEK